MKNDNGGQRDLPVGRGERCPAKNVAYVELKTN